AALVAVSPGANNLLAFVNGAQAGLRQAGRALDGRLAAFAIMVVLAALGLGALLERSAFAFGLLKWAGVAYLIGLGLRYWTAPPALGAAEPPPVARLARREFLTALANPKAYLLFTVFLPQFVVPGGGFVLQLLELGAIYVAVEGVAAMLWAGAGAGVGGRLGTPAWQVWMGRLCGGLMLGAAAALARAERAA
ncbi:MAG: LysE family translocator, partial [Rhodobacteraceae bacterium]|nr:LysE family translocator [Paracoccaceae bacterium]